MAEAAVRAASRNPRRDIIIFVNCGLLYCVAAEANGRGRRRSCFSGLAFFASLVLLAFGRGKWLLG